MFIPRVTSSKPMFLVYTSSSRTPDTFLLFMALGFYHKALNVTLTGQILSLYSLLGKPSRVAQGQSQQL